MQATVFIFFILSSTIKGAERYLPLRFLFPIRTEGPFASLAPTAKRALTDPMRSYFEPL